MGNAAYPRQPIDSLSRYACANKGAKIAGLSSGEFVGMVADDPDHKIKLKTFHAAIMNDRESLQKEQVQYKPLPEVARVTQEDIMHNYFQIRQDISLLIENEIELLLNIPGADNTLY